ncbi:hypothetical protein CF140_03340 [Aeromonas sobria]|nr:hypothetical protein CF140_03340 [Aeromonas sobria]
MCCTRACLTIPFCIPTPTAKSSTAPIPWRVTQQRDHLASLLSEADATILELYDCIADFERELPTSNVLLIDPRGRTLLADFR